MAYRKSFAGNPVSLVTRKVRTIAVLFLDQADTIRPLSST